MSLGIKVSLLLPEIKILASLLQGMDAGKVVKQVWRELLNDQ